MGFCGGYMNVSYKWVLFFCYFYNVHGMNTLATEKNSDLETDTQDLSVQISNYGSLDIKHTTQRELAEVLSSTVLGIKDIGQIIWGYVGTEWKPFLVIHQSFPSVEFCRNYNTAIKNLTFKSETELQMEFHGIERSSNRDVNGRTVSLISKFVTWNLHTLESISEIKLISESKSCDSKQAQTDLLSAEVIGHTTEKDQNRHIIAVSFNATEYFKKLAVCSESNEVKLLSRYEKSLGE